MKIIDEKIAVWGEPVDEGALSQIRTCLKTAHQVALMADHHKGYACPVGGVVAYKDKISPSVVGADCACGNKAVRLDVEASIVRSNISGFMDEIVKNISFGVGRKNNTLVDHKLFDSEAWKLEAVRDFKDLARGQLGTVGSSNHFVDLFVDELDRVWCGVHFGSRGIGFKTAAWFLEKGGAIDGMDVEPLVLDVNSNLGAEYIECMTLCGQYAYAGRDWVCAEVARILGANIVEEVHNNHNFAWKETHGGEELWVARKGSTPAFPKQKGFIGGSMGENSVIIEGVENEFGLASLYSTVHGAGRVMGRKQAKGKWKKGVCLREGLVSKEMMKEWITRAGVELRGGGVDESPHCYKRLSSVLEAHAGMIKVLHTLTPVGVAMAGEKDLDPYKD
jgi:tRNA-splicing ligase RtcB